MLGILCLSILTLIVKTYSGLSSLVMPRAPINEQQLDSYLSNKRSNLSEIMADIGLIADQLLGKSTMRRLCRINFLQICFCLVAFLWFEFQIAGPRLLSDFLNHGMAVTLDDAERNYLINNWPRLLTDYSLDGGRTFHINAILIDAAILSATIILAFSAASSISILFSLSLIRRIATKVRDQTLGPRLAAAFLFALACDFITIIVIIAAILVGGKSIGFFVRERFNASIDGDWLSHGLTIGRGSARENIGISFNYGINKVNFDDLEVVAPIPHSSIANWLLADPIVANDALKICNNRKFQPNCVDRLRALFLKSFKPPAVDLLVQWTGGLPYVVSWLSCGKEMWTALPGIGEGGSQAIRLIFPFAVSIGVLALAKTLMIPVLIATYLLNYSILELARYTARFSERGFYLVMVNATALFTAPPFIAITLILVARTFIC